MPLSVALISDVFYTSDAGDRLRSRLLEAKRGYPGCLRTNSALYARAWDALGTGS